MALWTPAQITTALWLDAADVSTLFDATSGGSLVDGDGAIARWEDKSGNARHVTQGTLANRPQRKTAIQNSRDIARFDGNDLLETTFAAFGTSYTIIVVSRSTNTAVAASVITTRSKTSMNPINQQLVFNGSGNTACAVRDNSGSVASSLIGSAANNTWYLLGSDRSGNSITHFRDGSAGTTGTATQGTTTTTVTSIGALYSGTGTANTFLNGDIAEIVACGLSDREIVEGYLAHKWGLAASLDASHPYKSSAPTVGGFTPQRRTAQASIRSTF
jgi:hypothetical protein